MSIARNLIALLLALALLFGPPGMEAAVAATLSVSPTGSDSGDCQSSPCRTITAAIANASAGDAISVSAGIYSSEAFPLIPNNISMTGASASTTIINAVGSGQPAVVIDDASTSQATVQGFTLKAGSAPAIEIYAVAGQDVSPAITLNTITSALSDGIYVYVYSTGAAFAVSSPTITGNTITGCAGDGIYIAGSSYARIDPGIMNNDIVDNDSSGISMGMWLGATGAFINGTISSNTIAYNGTHGMYIWAVSSGSAELSPSISKNTLTGNGGSAVYVSSNKTLDVLSPDLGGGVRGSAGLNTLKGNLFSGFSDLDNSSLSNTVSAMNNWFSSPASISNASSIVNYSSLSDALAFSVSPASGPVEGGGSLTIVAASGSAFVTDVGAAHSAVTVLIGGAAATVTSFSSASIVVTVPAGAAGYADVTVTNPAGQSGTLADGYTYSTTAVQNYPPSAPVLLMPEDGATGVISNSVTFAWSRSLDLEGSAVQYDLFVCAESTFATCATPVNAERIITSSAGNAAGAGAFLSGLIAIAGVMAAGLGLGSRRAALALMAAIALVALIAACGQGVSDEQAPSSDAVYYDMTGLSSATTYYWRVAAYDDADNKTYSAVSVFTTE